VSDASRVAITEALRVRPERLHVIREAPDPIFRHQPPEVRADLLRRFGLSGTDRYLLYVGGISPHKNLHVLVEAFELVAADDECVRLLLVGDADDDPFLSAAASIRAAVERSPARARIELTGRVSDDELVALYSGAVASALPSLGEGFGLTAAESAACGTPVVASRDPALVELLGDAGLYADAGRPHELAAHFAALLADPTAREAASIAVSRRASDWSWAAGADATIALLEGVARSRG
jgi:glycosyltransferase involved in cell wall biosynthesis